MFTSTKPEPVVLFIMLSLFFLLLPALVLAQTAGELDIMLETEAVSAAAAARFVLGAVELLPPGLSGPDAERAAFEIASSNGWLRAGAGEAINLEDTALLIMKAFDFKGGIMYSIFGNARYAYREMLYHRLIQGRSYPNMNVSGQRFLQILGRALSYAGEDEELDIMLHGDGE